MWHPADACRVNHQVVLLSGLERRARALRLRNSGARDAEQACEGAPARRGNGLPSATARLAYQATRAAERRGPSLSVKCVNASTSFPSAAGPRGGPTWKPTILRLADRSVKAATNGSRARR